MRRHRLIDNVSLARRTGPWYALGVALLSLFCSPVVLANAITALNHARATYCGLSSVTYPRLIESRKLNAVARLVAQGESLDRAQRRTGYHAARVMWIQITGATGEAAIERIVRRHFCRQLANPRLRRIGTYQPSSGELWIVVAQPFSVPAEQDATKVNDRVLELTNRARATGRTCGRRYFPPAPPLSLSSVLTRAARAHSQDMAAHGFFSHTGSDGSSPSQRVMRAGYRWIRVGENIASGVGSPRKVVADWLASPPHCANIMTAVFRQMGVAFAVNARSRGVIYWTEDFGTPPQRHPRRTR